MGYPTELKYTRDHEWAKIDGKTLTIGVTDHAQNSLGDIVYLELPEVEKELSKGDTFGVVESVKAVSDLYAPATGKVSEVNSPLIDDPSRINSDPHGDAWMIKMEVTDEGSISDLMDAAEYEKYVASLD